MCNMAAFAGSVPAAPVLLEMLERQEGLWSGHFSGISTIFEGKVYTARVCGNVARLRRETGQASSRACGRPGAPARGTDLPHPRGGEDRGRDPGRGTRPVHEGGEEAPLGRDAESEIGGEAGNAGSAGDGPKGSSGAGRGTK